MPDTTEQTVQKPKLADLETQAKELLTELKVKHKDAATPNAIDSAAKQAYAIWHKAASENTLTGAAQIDRNSGVTSLERYFVARLPRK